MVHTSIISIWCETPNSVRYSLYSARFHAVAPTPVSTLHVFHDNPSLHSTPTHLTPPGKYTWPQRGNHACVSSFRPIFHVFREGLKLVEAPPLSTATAASADASIPATTCFSRRSLPVHLALNVRVLHPSLSLYPPSLSPLACPSQLRNSKHIKPSNLSNARSGGPGGEILVVHSVRMVVSANAPTRHSS